MNEAEARNIIEIMKTTAWVDVFNLTQRIEELERELVFDGWEETAAQIKRLKDRLAKRDTEAHALSIAVTKFEVEA